MSLAVFPQRDEKPHLSLVTLKTINKKRHPKNLIQHQKVLTAKQGGLKINEVTSKPKKKKKKKPIWKPANGIDCPD